MLLLGRRIAGYLRSLNASQVLRARNTALRWPWAGDYFAEMHVGMVHRRYGSNENKLGLQVLQLNSMSMDRTTALGPDILRAENLWPKAEVVLYSFCSGIVLEMCFSRGLLAVIMLWSVVCCFSPYYGVRCLSELFGITLQNFDACLVALRLLRQFWACVQQHRRASTIIQYPDDRCTHKA